MSKSALYTANVSNQVVAVDGVINPGTIIRRFGGNLNLSGNAIQVAGPGYYDVDASFVVAPTAEGEVTITAYLNGVVVPGGIATATVAAAGDSANLSFNFVVRQNCSCCEGLSNLTFVLTGTAANVTNAAIVVEKL